MVFELANCCSLEVGELKLKVIGWLMGYSKLLISR